MAIDPSRISIDTTQMTVGEQSDLARALGCKTAKQYEARIAEIQRMYEQDGDFEFDVVPAFIWVALKGTNPGITIEEVKNLTEEQIEAMLPNDNGAESAAKSSPTTSGRSVSRTTTPRRSSGR